MWVLARPEHHRSIRAELRRDAAPRARSFRVILYSLFSEVELKVEEEKEEEKEEVSGPAARRSAV